MNLALGLLMIGCGILLLLVPQHGLVLVALVLGLAVILYGARKLVYYVTMGRHMAGGLSVLFIAVIAIDIGVFALAVIEDPKFAIVLYLVSYNMFTGVLAIARGIESMIFKSPWIASVVHGLINVALAVLCLVFISSDQTLIVIFCIGLFYSAGVRLVSAFKPTEIIFIQ